MAVSWRQTVEGSSGARLASVPPLQALRWFALWSGLRQSSALSTPSSASTPSASAARAESGFPSLAPSAVARATTFRLASRNPSLTAAAEQKLIQRPPSARSSASDPRNSTVQSWGQCCGEKASCQIRSTCPRRCSSRCGSEQGRQVCARAYAHLHHPQPPVRCEALQLRGHHKGFPRFPESPATAVKCLRKPGAPEAEAAIAATKDLQIRRFCPFAGVGSGLCGVAAPLGWRLSAAGGPDHPRSRGRTRRRRRCHAGGCRRWPPRRPPPGSLPRGGRFRCPPQRHAAMSGPGS